MVWLSALLLGVRKVGAIDRSSDLIMHWRDSPKEAQTGCCVSWPFRVSHFLSFRNITGKASSLGFVHHCVKCGVRQNKGVRCVCVPVKLLVPRWTGPASWLRLVKACSSRRGIFLNLSEEGFPVRASVHVPVTHLGRVPDQEILRDAYPSRSFCSIIFMLSNQSSVISLLYSGLPSNAM